MYTVNLRALWLLFAIALCTAQPSSARAQDAERERQAKTEFEAGVAAAQAEDYARAREHFLRSRQLVVKASTLLNLALADLKLGRVEEALFALDAIEAPVEGPQQDRLRQRARKMRGEIEALREALTAKRAEQERAYAASAAPVEAPKAAAASTPEAEVVQAIEEEPGQQGPAPGPGQQGPAPAFAGEARVSEERAPAEDASSRGEPSLIGPRTLLVLGGVLGAGAIGSGLWWRNRNVANDDCLNERDDRCPQHAKIGRERTAAMAVALSLSGAAVGLIASGAVWLVGKKRDVRENRVSVSFWTERTRLGAVASGRF